MRSPTKRDGSSLTQLEIKTQKQKQHTDVSEEDNLRDLQDHRHLVEGRGIGGPTLAYGYSARPLQSHTLVTLPCAGASRVFDMVPAGSLSALCQRGPALAGQRMHARLGVVLVASSVQFARRFLWPPQARVGVVL